MEPNGILSVFVDESGRFQHPDAHIRGGCPQQLSAKPISATLKLWAWGLAVVGG